MQSKLLSLLFLFGLATSILYSSAPTNKFQEFKKQYGKNYNDQFEEKYRETIFNKKLLQIYEHNKDTTKTYWKGINKFSDLTKEEFNAIYRSKRLINTKQLANQYQSDKIKIGAGINWVEQGKVSKVKDQGDCGSCYAFSTNGAIQSAYLFTGTSLDLSEQELVDCSDNQGCDGGDYPPTFHYIVQNRISLQKDYKYVGEEQDCQVPTRKQKYSILGYIPVNGCEAIINAILKRPISVSIDQSGMEDYHGGIFNDCGSDVHDASLLVGITDSWWLLKKSWGTDWGENGFIRVQRGGNNCGICSRGFYPVLN